MGNDVELYDKIGEQFSHVVKQNISAISQFKYDFFLYKLFKKSQSVLIIGCGGGVQSEFFPRSINLDIDIDCLKFCQAKGIDNLILGDARYLPFKSGSFNEILLADVIEHLPDKTFFNNVVIELFRISKNKGKVAVIGPLKDNILIVRKLYNKLMKLPIPKMAQPEHTLALSKKELILAFKGFQVVLDNTWRGTLFGLGLPMIGGEHAFIIFQKKS